MKLKQTAAWGLGALLLGSSMMALDVNAASTGLSPQTTAQDQLAAMIDQHVLLALSQSASPVPMSTSQQKAKNGFWGWHVMQALPVQVAHALNPFALLSAFNPFSLLQGPVFHGSDAHRASANSQSLSSVARVAKSFPIVYLPGEVPLAAPAEPRKARYESVVESAATSHTLAFGTPMHARSGTRLNKPEPLKTASPVRPVFTMNPLFTVAAPAALLVGDSVASAESKTDAGHQSSPATVTESQALAKSAPSPQAKDSPVALLATGGDPGSPVLLPSSPSQTVSGPLQSLLPQLDQPATAMRRAGSGSGFHGRATSGSGTHAYSSGAGNSHSSAQQALPNSPLSQIMALNQAAGMHYAPGLDTSSPDINLNNDAPGSVKVLKSGVSSKMNSIDLAIGKAEVLYLSRPATRVSVSNPDVAAAVIISPTQIQLTGKSVGVANLLVWGDMNSPDHTVVDISVHRDVSVLVNQLKYVDPGIQIVPMAAEDTVILTGQAETRESAQLAIEIAKAFFAKSGSMGAGPMPGSGNNGPNSQAPGSAQPGMATNVINLMKIKGEPSTKLELVRQRMQQIDPNVHVEVVPGPDGGEKVILTGRVATASIASKALNLASVFYGQPGMKMVTSQGGNQYTKLSASTASSSSSSSSGSSSSTPDASTAGANMLQGSIMTDATGNVISMLEIAQKPQIRCSIKFLELSKTALNAMGGTLNGVAGTTKVASWSGVQSAAPGKGIAILDTQTPPGSSWATAASRASTGGGWQPSSQTFAQAFREVYQNGITQAFTINNQLAGAIQALQERRQVRTLAEPTLTMLSGEQGSFLAGGEVPIAFVGGQGQVSIQYKEFGIRLNLLPNVTDDGKIQMQVAPEVSSLDAANGVSTNSISVPAFVSRKMSTTLLVEQGQSFILAGLYNQQDTDSMSRFPGLGSVPMLGTFFRNKWKNKTSSEMVVVIKPEIIYSNTGITTPQPLSELPAPKAELSKQ